MANWWKKNQEDKPSGALVSSGRRLSDQLLALDEVGQERAAETIRNIVNGIRTLGELPESIVDELWGMMMTIARKAIVGHKPETLIAEVKAGLHPEIEALIYREAEK